MGNAVRYLRRFFRRGKHRIDYMSSESIERALYRAEVDAYLRNLANGG